MVRQTNNTITLRHGPESTFDTAPTATTIWRGVTSETLAAVPEFVESDEEDGTLITPDHILVGMGTRGDVNVEWSYGAHDDFIARSIGASTTWVAEAPDIGGAVTVTPTANTLTLSSTDWDTQVPGIARGRWIHMSGWATSTNDGFFRVESVTTGTVLTVSGLTALGTDGATALSTLVVIALANVSTGTTLATAAIEKAYGDHTTGDEQFSQFLGLDTVGMSVGFPNGKAIVTGAFSFAGTRDVPNATALDASPDPATTAGVYTAADLDGFVEGSSTAATTPIVSWNLRVAKGNYAFDEAGFLRPQQFGKGRIVVSGSIDTFYENNDMYTKAVSEVKATNSTALGLILGNPGGTYIFDVPACRLMNPRKLKEGRDQPTFARFDYAAYYHTNSSAGLRVARKA